MTTTTDSDDNPDMKTRISLRARNDLRRPLETARRGYLHTTAWIRGTSRRGAYVLWFALGMFALAMMLGLVVDGGGKVHTRQHANLVAEEAARAAGQQIIRPLGMRGIATVVDPALAQAAAQLYLTKYPDVHGVVVPTGPTTLLITTESTYNPKILGMIGVGPQTVTGRAVVTLNRTNNGTPGLP